ncbi:putative cytosol aminopeptidase protein [Cryptosporidium serpentis]
MESHSKKRAIGHDIDGIRPSKIPLSASPEVNIQFSLISKELPISEKNCCLVVCIPSSGSFEYHPIFEFIDQYLDGILKSSIQKAIDANLFASECSAISINLPPSMSYESLIIVSTGTNLNLSANFFVKLSNILQSHISQYHINSAMIAIPFETKSGILLNFLADLILKSIEDHRFKGIQFHPKNKNKKFENIHLLVNNEQILSECNSKISSIIATATGLLFARDLATAPPNYCNPVNMAHEVLEMAKKVGLSHKVLNTKECEELGMGAYIGVLQGSKYPAQFVHLHYKPEGPIHHKLAFVGKGITMDTGGYNLKSHPNIQYMKNDMAGAAAVFGSAYSIGLIKPKHVEIHFISAICENSISQNAYLPGCILTASNGKTIEVGNTDAEGRLTLADALVYSCNLEVDKIVDLATLTGLSMSFFSGKYASLLGNSDEFISTIETSGHHVGEKFCKLPLDTDYKEHIKSNIADLNNMCGSVAGVITSTLFLSEFIREGISYAHIDMAGCSGKDNVSNGFGVKTLIELAMNYSNKKS